MKDFILLHLTFLFAFFQISSRVLTSQIKHVYENCRSNAAKKTISQILAGKIVAKYRCKTKLSADSGRGIKTITDFKDPADVLFSERKEKSTSVVLRSEVEDFYLENSTIDPSKKNCKKINGEPTPRQYLTASKVDLHKKFCDEKQKFISLTTFCKYCPYNVVAPKLSARDTCACPTHEKFNFLVKALHENIIISENTTHKIIRSLTCDKVQDECFERNCTKCRTRKIVYNTNDQDLKKEVLYKKWINVTENRESGKTKKQIQVKFVKEFEFLRPLEDILDIFKQEIQTILSHERRIFHQYHAIKNLKAKITPQKNTKDVAKDDEGLFLWDFAENYNCKYNTEIQGVHFGAARQQVSLHTGYIYTSEINEGYCTLSVDLSHESTAVIAHMTEIFNFYISQLKNLKTLHLLSDGPSTQYRNKTMFFLITQYLPSLYPQIEHLTYNFYESHHGKSPADSQGGILKVIGDVTVKYGENVNTFEKFVEVLKKRVKNVHISTISSTDIKGVEHLLTEK